MSTLAIAKALETRLMAMAQSLPTVTENTGAPQSAEAYQEVYFLYNKPENPTVGNIGNELTRQRGYMQVKLKYPTNQGKGAARAKGDQIANWFPRGLSLTADGVTSIIEQTPEVGNGSNEDGRYVINVFVYFFANIIK